uniref:Uncharacterized protein n=2 Tax=Chenopodium quinoa TaxID=63459 RepID=A0A803KQA8_CHEQI
MNFKELLFEAIELLQDFCLGDFVPWLSWVDRVRGLEGRVQKVAKGLDEFLDTVVQEHQNLLCSKENTDAESEEGKNAGNFVDFLLEFRREKKNVFLSDDIKAITRMKAITLDVFAAGTEPIYALIEWTMCELIRHPKIMKELQKEVRKIPGPRVTEDDLGKLVYLKAVIKEALRLHPPAPLLLFREPSQDVKLFGYDIKAGTQVIINAWAIQRDINFWDEPEEFRRERFLDGNTFDFKGPEMQYIPFGGGRRICPGISFTIVNVELIIANLIYEFDWKVPDGIDELDVAESVGFTVHKLIPLKVVATPFTCK